MAQVIRVPAAIGRPAAGFLVVAALLLSSGCSSRIESPITVAPTQTTLDFSQQVPGTWDRVYVFGPYTSSEQVNRVLGFDWPEFAQTRIESSDSVCLVLLVKDGSVVSWFEQSRDIDLDALENGAGYARKDARFRVEHEARRAVVRP